MKPSQDTFAGHALVVLYKDHIEPVFSHVVEIVCLGKIASLIPEYLGLYNAEALYLRVKYDFYLSHLLKQTPVYF
jgi:hypothetical protein